MYIYPGIPTTIKTMGVNITTIAYLRVLIIEIGSTIILMVVEAQGIYRYVFIYLSIHIHMGNKSMKPFQISCHFLLSTCKALVSIIKVPCHTMNHQDSLKALCDSDRQAPRAAGGGTRDLMTGSPIPQTP